MCVNVCCLLYFFLVVVVEFSLTEWLLAGPLSMKNWEQSLQKFLARTHAPPSIKQCPVGSAGCARSVADKRWYRCHVTRVISAKKLEVSEGLGD